MKCNVFCIAFCVQFHVCWFLFLVWLLRYCVCTCRTGCVLPASGVLAELRCTCCAAQQSSPQCTINLDLLLSFPQARSQVVLCVECVSVTFHTQWWLNLRCMYVHFLALYLSIHTHTPKQMQSHTQKYSECKILITTNSTAETESFYDWIYQWGHSQ